MWMGTTCVEKATDVKERSSLSFNQQGMTISLCFFVVLTTFKANYYCQRWWSNRRPIVLDDKNLVKQRRGTWNLFVSSHLIFVALDTIQHKFIQFSLKQHDFPKAFRESLNALLKKQPQDLQKKWAWIYSLCFYVSWYWHPQPFQKLPRMSTMQLPNFSL